MACPEALALDSRADFYAKTVATCIPDRGSSILVVGAGEFDRDVFVRLDYRNVVLTNIDTSATVSQFSPFEWQYQNAERLGYADESFDVVVTHAALHHCRSPHRALLEMYRTARIGVLAIESREGWLMKLMGWLNLTQAYETTAVFYNEGKAAGVENTEIPNFIYRWTEREVEKTIRSFAPEADHHIRFFYGNDIPVTPGLERGGGLKTAAIRLLAPFYRLFARIFPRQQNLFGFWIPKPEVPQQLQPWLLWEDGKARFNAAWAEARYRQSAV